VGFTVLTGLARATGDSGRACHGPGGEGKRVPRSAEGRGDDSYVLGFIGMFTGCEL
jgi:hypothetical protein